MHTRPDPPSLMEVMPFCYKNLCADFILFGVLLSIFCATCCSRIVCRKGEHVQTTSNPQIMTHDSSPIAAWRHQTQQPNALLCMATRAQTFYFYPKSRQTSKITHTRKPEKKSAHYTHNTHTHTTRIKDSCHNGQGRQRGTTETYFAASS